MDLGGEKKGGSFGSFASLWRWGCARSSSFSPTIGDYPFLVMWSCPDKFCWIPFPRPRGLLKSSGPQWSARMSFKVCPFRQIQTIDLGCLDRRASPILCSVVYAPFHSVRCAPSPRRTCTCTEYLHRYTEHVAASITNCNTRFNMIPPRKPT